MSSFIKNIFGAFFSLLKDIYCFSELWESDYKIHHPPKKEE